jgi:hypothetical protein
LPPTTQIRRLRKPPHIIDRAVTSVARRHWAAASTRSRSRSATTAAAACSGYQVSQAIHVAVTLGIPDLLAHGPVPSCDVAAATDAHPDALYRLLRALASIGVLHEDEQSRFSLTDAGDGLRTDAPGSLAGWAAFVGSPAHSQAWGHLLHSVRSGENAFCAVHGVDVWAYRVDHPQEGAIFDRAMASLTGFAHASLLAAYDFSRFRTVVDVGGGRGALLAALLPAHPALEGVLFDQPQVVAGAEEVLSDAGLTARCQIVGGSAYLLKSILHDWQDEQAVTILRACRRAIDADGTLLVIERVLAPPNEGPEAKFSDLNMLVSAGGRERTREAFEELLRAGDFRLDDETPTSSGLSVIAARPA